MELLDSTEVLELISLLLDTAVGTELLEATALLLDTITELLIGSFASELLELTPCSCSGLEHAKNKNMEARIAKKTNILCKYVRIFIPPE
jgi:hypothetical protein